MRPLTDHITLRIPRTIRENIEAKLQWDVPNWVKKPNVDKFLYVISKIITLSSENRKYARLKLVPLSSIVLRHELGKHYRKYIDWLITNKFIETDNHYVVGNPERDGKCKCFGISKVFKSKKLIGFQLQDNFILKKLLNWRKTKLSETVEDPLMARLYTMMSSFSIDIESATVELDSLLESKLISQKQYDLELMKCQKINGDDDDSTDLFIVKDQYSRVHTNITNISKRIREKHLYVGGKKAVGIDIVSSQPALLHSLFQDYINRIELLSDDVRSSQLYIELGDCRCDVRTKYNNTRNSYDGDAIFDPDSEVALSKLGCTTFDVCLSSLQSEVSYFEQSLVGMGIYEFFQDQWSMFNDNDDVDRDEMKTIWLSYVFGRGNGHRMAPKVEDVAKIWKVCFPMLDKLLNYFKVGDYKTLAHNLQRKEADLMYNKVCPRVEKEFGVSFSTVHDSIIVEESIMNEVADLFDEILEENSICTTTSMY